MTGRTGIVLFTRDLRVHDHPALATSCAAFDRVVPLYVLDPALAQLSPNRTRFLHQSLAALRAALRGLGGDLVLRHGDPVAETIRLAGEVGAEGIALSADVSRYAERRATRLRAECERHRLHLRFFPGLTVVDPGALRPTGGDHYRVFSPYHRAWSAHRWRDELGPPARVTLPAQVPVGRLPAVPAGDSPEAVPGGEDEAWRRLTTWLPAVPHYGDRHDDLAGDGTSRLSPYLRFGCLSPLTVANRADRDSPFVRQLCWRDFYHQVTAAFPDISRRAYRRGATEHWRYADDTLAAWQQGRTGLPIVDAGMRQLRAQGWLHNRARLITAGYLTKTMGLDWRDGVAVYFRWLLDGDVANNSGNWQWVAGTGNDTRPYRGFNPIRQAERYDPDGAYVRRWVPELATVPGAAVHQPWRLPTALRRTLDYPSPLEVPGPEPVWLR
ncbi:cryptochrome/photolyase family protein [Micromonospora endophytica]|uniref:Deoxyribodipyrimidine photolyase n=1 Tax=Micromonospora endophytica TaxID=515350 RepID=A0A2W2C2A6_9ACTN|nr:deoxyribodipyrimidine photo-lyase [Micromonospora endophytica]PZF93631.1 deoxyribodipyrimidine photolyase [Micromonospora endophytica]RIW46820.1 deoxyribodipyrimidine photo-lyase [Micromonospora endophytica]BCJ59209.1 deoxyribodipyrimidine photo-lyase [Micromonospora endophytica]